MSVVAQVKDGKFVNGANDNKRVAEEKKTPSTTLDKNSFMQLLVAQMKYQDPLEPTDNTEYISQLATFSSLEQMQNMNASMDLQRGSALVGQEVYLETTDKTTGETNSVSGVVDYVTYENNKCYLSINGSLYSLDDVKSVYDPKYTAAYEKAFNFTVALNKLPPANKVTLGSESDVNKLQEIYEGMDDYQKSFVTKDNQKKLEDLVAKIKELKALKKAQDERDAQRTDEVVDEDNEANETQPTTNTNASNEEASNHEEETENAENAGAVAESEGSDDESGSEGAGDSGDGSTSDSEGE